MHMAGIYQYSLPLPHPPPTFPVHLPKEDFDKLFFELRNVLPIMSLGHYLKRLNEGLDCCPLYIFFELYRVKKGTIQRLRNIKPDLGIILN